ncbi:hypothetical protein AAMO2058_001067900 [Amorphochlora amoebiformis]
MNPGMNHGESPEHNSVSETSSWRTRSRSGVLLSPEERNVMEPVYVVRFILGGLLLSTCLFQMIATNNVQKRTVVSCAGAITLSLCVYWIDPDGSLGYFNCLTRLVISRIPLSILLGSSCKVLTILITAITKVQPHPEKTQIRLKTAKGFLLVAELGICIEVIAIAVTDIMMISLLSNLLVCPLLISLMYSALKAMSRFTSHVNSIRLQVAQADPCEEVDDSLALIENIYAKIIKIFKCIVGLGAASLVINLIVFTTRLTNQHVSWCESTSSSTNIFVNYSTIAYLAYPLFFLMYAWVPLREGWGNITGDELNTHSHHMVIKSQAQANTILHITHVDLKRESKIAFDPVVSFSLRNKTMVQLGQMGSPYSIKPATLDDASRSSSDTRQRSTGARQISREKSISTTATCYNSLMTNHSNIVSTRNSNVATSFSAGESSRTLLPRSFYNRTSHQTRMSDNSVTPDSARKNSTSLRPVPVPMKRI